MKTVRLLLCLFITVACRLGAAEPLDAKATAFLAGYEKVRAALAADSLSAAQTAAADLEGGAAIAKAKSIGDARKAFKVLSEKAVALAKGRPGYFHMFCSMYPPSGGDWIQTTREISNPYWGKTMLRCGEIKE